MNEEKEQEERRALKFITYQTLYVNDRACGAIKDLAHYLDNNKETKKIYGALLKRVNAYKKIVNDIISDPEPFTEYCDTMDDIIDDSLDNLYNAYYDYLGTFFHDETTFFSKLEYAYTMVDFANTFLLKTMRAFPQISNKAKHLNYLKLTDAEKIINNLTDWCYFLKRDIFKGKVDLNGNEEIKTAIKNISGILLDYDAYEKGINSANNYTTRKFTDKRRVITSYNGNKVEYESVSAAARALHCSRKTIHNYSKSGAKYRRILTIKIL